MRKVRWNDGLGMALLFKNTIAKQTKDCSNRQPEQPTYERSRKVTEYFCSQQRKAAQCFATKSFGLACSPGKNARRSQDAGAAEYQSKPTDEFRLALHSMPNV